MGIVAKCLFIYFEEGGREREKMPSRLCNVSVEFDAGLELINCKIMT